MEKILELYKKQGFHFSHFYEILKMRSVNSFDLYTTNKRFLQNQKTSTDVLEKNEVIVTEAGDIRVDLPVWYGDFANSSKKVMVIGLEPRDTDLSGRLNIERYENIVYATPFALEIENNKYQKAFTELNLHNDFFVYYTDIVKTYNVTKNKKVDDKSARGNFIALAQQGAEFLLQEINLVKPDIILALGKECEKVLKKLMENESVDIKYVRHPSQGGQNIAQQNIKEIIEMLTKRDMS
jgi:hypothetical protein